MRTLADGVVPSNFYSAQEIAKYEHIPLEKMASLAKQTQAAIVSAAREQGYSDITKFTSYYNTYRNGLISNNEINHFYWHTNLQPFAHLFHFFVARRKGTMCDAVFFCCGFGVQKSHYDRYKQTGKLPVVDNRGKLPKYDTPARGGRSKVQFEGGGRIDIPMNAVYKRFVEGIERCNRSSENRVTVPEMVLNALREFMDRRIELFGEQAVVIDEEKLPRKTNHRIRFDADETLSDEITKCLSRYNAVNIPGLTLSEFMTLAARGLLERMPLEYVAPDYCRRKGDDLIE